MRWPEPMPWRPQLLAAMVAFWLCLPGGAADAQRVELRVDPEPHYLGVPFRIEVNSQGFDRSPEPSCGAPAPSVGTLTLRGISPNIESSIQIINGRMTKSERVRFTCHFEYVSQKEGSIQLGPFAMEQNGKEVTAGTVRANITRVPLDPRLKLRVRLSDKPVYVGQHVPVTIEWWLERSLSEKIHGFTVRSPLFRRDEDFRFIDDSLAQRGDQALNIETAQGELKLKAQVKDQREGGKRFIVLSAQRTMIPMRSGKFELPPAQIEVDEVVQWRRDFFGGRTAGRTRKLLSRDVERTLHVREPPLKNRPATYTGAVGRSFSLEVSPSRSVVQRGDPIVLTLTIRGDGNLKVLGPPLLSGPGGLAPEQFGLPDDADIGGRIVGDTKVFEVTVRVLDEDLREVPALAYSWFDPDRAEYQTTHSRPIALSVKPAQIVSASDVVAASSEVGDDEALASESSGGGPAAAKTSQPTAQRSGEAAEFSTIGADLSIERDVDRLVGGRASQSAVQWSGYGAGVLAIALALVLRRRREADPELKRRRALIQQQRLRINKTSSLAPREAAAECASALREVIAACPELQLRELEAFLQDCDDLLYAPSEKPPAGQSRELTSRASALLDALEGRLQ